MRWLRNTFVPLSSSRSPISAGGASSTFMAYCPRCLTEYREGSTECIDCGVLLKPGAPPHFVPESDEPPMPLVRLRTFSGPTAQLDADLAKNILATQGIPCVLPGQQMAETLPGVDVVQMLVREQDAEEAADILRSYLDQPAPPGDDSEPQEEG
jgi:putative signal transducing protein